jgi:Arc/MetJ-type ribon-helix-helix transcriptional regulator
MKEKTSITLSKQVLIDIDRMAGSKQSRSAFIEAVLAAYLQTRKREDVEARDLDRINRAADELNPEVEDILRYQAIEEQRNHEARGNLSRSPARRRSQVSSQFRRG